MKIVNRNKQLKNISKIILNDIENGILPADLKYYLLVKDGIINIMSNRQDYEAKKHEYKQLGILDLNKNDWSKHLKILILFK